MTIDNEALEYATCTSHLDEMKYSARGTSGRIHVRQVKIFRERTHSVRKRMSQVSVSITWTSRDERGEGVSTEIASTSLCYLQMVHLHGTRTVYSPKRFLIDSCLTVLRCIVRERSKRVSSLPHACVYLSARCCVLSFRLSCDAPCEFHPVSVYLLALRGSLRSEMKDEQEGVRDERLRRSPSLTTSAAEQRKIRRACFLLFSHSLRLTHRQINLTRKSQLGPALTQ